MIADTPRESPLLVAESLRLLSQVQAAVVAGTLPTTASVAVPLMTRLQGTRAQAADGAASRARVPGPAWGVQHSVEEVECGTPYNGGQHEVRTCSPTLSATASGSEKQLLRAANTVRCSQYTNNQLY